MIISSAEVTSEKRVLGEANFPQFESVEEALNHPEYGLGETRLLEILNAQIKTNAMNKLRTDMTKGPSKGALRSEAMNEIVQEISSGEHQHCIGNREALEQLVAERMKKIEQRIETARQSAGATGAMEDEDEGSNEGSND